MSGRGVVISDDWLLGQPTSIDDDDAFLVSRRRSRSKQPPAPPEPQQGIALYSRYSRERVGGEASEERQFANSERAAAQLPGAIVSRYSDRGISGATLVRDGLKQLMVDAAKGLFRILVVESVSRLGRDLGDLLFVFDKIERLGIEIWTSNGQRVDRNRLFIEGLLAHLERTEKIAVWRRGRHAAFQRGMLSQRVPFGFALDRRFPGHRFPHPQRAPVVADMYRRILSGESTTSVATWLTGSFPTPGECSRDGSAATPGTVWTTSMVREIIQNPMNAGLLSDGRTKQLIDPDSLQILGVEYVDPIEWDVAAIVSRAIVDSRTWLDAVAALPRTMLTRGIVKQRHAPLLKGLAWCGVCSGTAKLKYGSKYGNKSAWFTCVDAACDGFGEPSRQSVELAALRAVLGQADRAIGPAAQRLVASVRTMEIRLPFIGRSDEDQRAADAVREVIENLLIRPASQEGSQKVDVALARRGSSGQEDCQTAAWDRFTIELSEPGERSATSHVDLTAPLADAERLRLLSENAWGSIEPLARECGLTLKRTGWETRSLVEMMILFCLSDRRPYDVPSNLGPFGTFVRAAKRAVRTGFIDQAFAVLRRSHPLVIAGARTDRIDRFREGRTRSRFTHQDAEAAAASAPSKGMQARLHGVASIMSGKRLDLIASKRLRLAEPVVAAWVILFREGGLSSFIKGSDSDVDADALNSAIDTVKGWAEQSDDPVHRARLHAIEGYLLSQPKADVAEQAGVAWNAVRKWITDLMTSGPDELRTGVNVGILSSAEIDELRSVILGRVDPDHPEAPVSGLVLKRICRSNFGRELAVNSVMMHVARGWTELENGEIDLGSGFRSTMVKQLVALVRRELDPYQAEENSLIRS